MTDEGSVRIIRNGNNLYRRIHSLTQGRISQTLNFQIPPHIVAEALQAHHGSADTLAYQWSAPSSDEEMKFIEQYVQEKYPDILVKSTDIAQIAPEEDIVPEERPTAQDSSHHHGIQRWFSPISSSKGHDSHHGTRARLRKYLSLDWAEVPSNARLNSNSQLWGVLSRNENNLGNMSVSEFHARYKVLNLCGVKEDEYHVIFTSTRQEALRLVAEAYPFRPNTTYLTAMDSDPNRDIIPSVATEKGCKVKVAPLTWLDLRIDGSQLSAYLRKRSSHNPRGLFAYPLKSPDKQFSMDWVSEARRNLWHVLIDASQEVLDVDNETLIMEDHKPDYLICISPKHIMFPNRVTCLLVRKSSQTL